MRNSFSPFGDLLKQLRKRAGMTQGDLAAALGYSIALISALERNQRLPDLDAVIQRYIAALTLQEEPHLAVQLVEAAARARGERPPGHLDDPTRTASSDPRRGDDQAAAPTPATHRVDRA